MEAMEGGNIVIVPKYQVEAHMIQHFQVLTSSLVVEEVVVVEVGKADRVEEEVMEEQPFVYLPLIRLRLMAQS